MHLRSGRLLGESRAEIASQATTNESTTLSLGKGIDQSSSGSDFSSMAESEGRGFISPINLANDRGKAPMNPFTIGLEHNEKLAYLYENPRGALIYRDPKGRYLVKTAEYPTSFQSEPWVNPQGDISIGEDGARYVVTEFPDLVDTFGLVKLNGEATEDIYVSLRGDDGTGTSARHATLGASSASSKPNWEANLGPKSHPLGQNDPQGETGYEISVTKVLQDNPLQEIYRDDQNTYFGTTRWLNDALPHFHVLRIESMGGKPLRIRDRQGNEYRTLDWSEVRDLTWKGQPLFTQVTPARTARANEPAYSAQTVEPSMQSHGSNWAPSFVDWNIQRPVYPTPRPMRPP